MGRNVALKDLLLFAYHLHGSQLSGPDWIETEGYDITAEVNHPVTPAQLRQMLPALLEDRFKLQSHRETKEIHAYWLVVAKGGSKLRDEKEGAEATAALEKEGKSPFRPGLAVITKPCDLPQFAERLGRPHSIVPCWTRQGSKDTSGVTSSGYRTPLQRVQVTSGRSSSFSLVPRSYQL